MDEIIEHLPKAMSQANNLAPDDAARALRAGRLMMVRRLRADVVKAEARAMQTRHGLETYLLALELDDDATMQQLEQTIFAAPWMER